MTRGGLSKVAAWAVVSAAAVAFVGAFVANGLGLACLVIVCVSILVTWAIVTVCS